jgi:hypothetical protein
MSARENHGRIGIGLKLSSILMLPLFNTWFMCCFQEEGLVWGVEEAVDRGSRHLGIG